MNKNIYQGINIIDVLKLFFSFCIVGIHTNLLNSLPDNIEWIIMHLIFRLGVPFFFVSSSFFLGLKINSNPQKYKEILRKYRERLFPPLAVWGGIGTIFYMIELFIEGKGFWGIIFRVMRTIIFYPQGAMWFVLACIIASVLLELIIQNRCKIYIITILSIVLYAFALCANTYSFLCENTFLQLVVDIYMKLCKCARNGIFLFVFFWGGYIITRPKIQKWLDANRFKTRLMLIFSSILFVMEVLFTYGKNVRDDSSLFFSFIILIPILVYCVTKLNINLELPYREMRSMSTVIYYVHPVICSVWSLLFEVDGGIKFIIVSLCCVVVYMFSRNSTNELIRKIL